MALEDVFLLSRILREKPEYTIADTFRVYDERRRPRVDEMVKTAERNGGVRKQTSEWKLAMNEKLATGALWAYQALGLEKFGLGQKPLAYDPEEENLDLNRP